MTKTRLLIATTLLAHATLAAAAPDDSAETAFKRAQAAFKAGRIHEACEAYEASEKLEAKVETELGLAACYEQDGKPMAAARLYRGLAEKDPNLERRKTSSAKIAKLEAKAAKLRFAINPNPPGLVIKVDGLEVSSTADVLVDLGPHEVVATAPGYEGHASAPVDRDRQVLDVIIRMQPRAEATPAPAPAPTPAPAATQPAPTPVAEAPAVAPAPMPAPTEREPDHRRRNGLIVGAVGVGVLIGAAVLFESSASKFDDEHALCPGSKCANDMDLAKANSLLSDGHTLRGLSIGMGIGSAVLLVAGGYLLVTPHREESRVSLHADHHGAGFVYTRRF